MFNFYSSDSTPYRLIMQVIMLVQVIFIHFNGCKWECDWIGSFLEHKIPRVSSLLQHDSFDVMCTHTISYPNFLSGYTDKVVWDQAIRQKEWAGVKDKKRRERIKFCRYQYCYKGYTPQKSLSVEHNWEKILNLLSLHPLEDTQLQSDTVRTLLQGRRLKEISDFSQSLVCECRPSVPKPYRNTEFISRETLIQSLSLG